MIILNLIAENIKKLRAVSISPLGNLVQITGKNGQGKTSVLDALWWGITGQKNVQGEPIRQGENTAKIVLDCGELIITRNYRKNEKGETISSITCESATGSRISSPQALLDSLIGSLALDPLEFARADDKKQFDILKRFVPGYDFEMKAIERAKLFDDRSDVNRRWKAAAPLADKIVISSDAAIVRVDEEAILAEIKGMVDENALTSKKAENREKLRQKITSNGLKAEANRKEIEALGRRITELLAETAEMESASATSQKRLDDAPPLPDLLTTDGLMEKLAAAKRANAQVAARDERDSYLQSASDLQSESDALTAKIAAIDKDKADAVAAAKLPIQGLGIGDGLVLLNGVPFKQSSDADQLKTSCAIAMSANPKLRVIRVRDGSLLDEDSLKIVEMMAIDNDYQVWIERVDSTGKVGFVLEDGMIVSSVPSDAKDVTPKKAQLPAPAKPSTPATPKKDLPSDII